MNNKGCVVDSNLRNLRKHGKVLGVLLHQHQQQQNKKQVRKRLHTARPYQERLLNMAEARKEIATFLKFHRAAMKQATEQRQQQQQQQEKPLVSLQPSHGDSSFEQDGIFKSLGNPRIYESCTTNNFSNCMDENDFSCSTFTHPPNYYTIAPSSPQVVAKNPNFSLIPNQTLGLNLNLQDFKNIDDDDTLFLNNDYKNNSSSSFCSYSSTTPTSIEGVVSSSVVDTIESSATTTHVISEGSLHAAVDDEGMAEMRLLGEQYQMEWNDTMNLVTSVRWSNFLNNIEHGAVVVPQVKRIQHDDDDDTYQLSSS
ncbi:hypothetical protein RIF29_27311 [Crotalaria pallida]|uniref:Uncharacterized protein n=1 Tax=Crotalaria pallida TaxID=3830 RepID=A0AAN9HYM7_CROPI